MNGSGADGGVGAVCVKNRMPILIEPEVVDESTCIVELALDDPRQSTLWLELLEAEFEAAGSARAGQRGQKDRRSVSASHRRLRRSVGGLQEWS